MGREGLSGFGCDQRSDDPFGGEIFGGEFLDFLLLNILEVR